MRTRQNIIEIFSAFLKFDADRLSGWITDPQLRRSIQRCLSQQPETAENFWALYWYKVWETQPQGLAKGHLVAYLQEACYWAAEKIVASFSIAHYSLPDCFQIAIAQIDKVLKGFKPQHGERLKNYAAVIFSSVIREVLRQRREVDICTPWSFLRKISQKRLIEALQAAGLSTNTVASYVLAWNCFKTIYVPTSGMGTRKLDKPDHDTLSAIASLYNNERQTQLNPPGNQSTPEIIEKWLLNCAKAARDYLYPSLGSINTPTPGQESGELADILPNPEQESLLTELIIQEEERGRISQRSQLQDVLVAAMAQLEPEAQKLLQMYYGQGLTQQQISQELQIKQYTISRRLTKTRELLLLALGRWSQDTLHISLNSDLIKNTSTILEEWLSTYYRRPH